MGKKERRQSDSNVAAEKSSNIEPPVTEQSSGVSNVYGINVTEDTNDGLFVSYHNQRNDQLSTTNVIIHVPNLVTSPFTILKEMYTAFKQYISPNSDETAKSSSNPRKSRKSSKDLSAKIAAEKKEENIKIQL